MTRMTRKTKTAHELGAHTQHAPTTGNEACARSAERGAGALPRGAIGAFGRKAATRLGAWLIVMAALLAFAGPANAQEREEIWSATLIAQDLTSNIFGCHNFAVDGRKCSESAVLSDDDFMLRSADITVRSVRLDSGKLSLAVSPPSGSSAYQYVNLLVGSTTLTFASATHSTVQTADQFAWTMSGLIWSEDDSIALRMTDVNLPELESIVVTATGQQIELAYDDPLDEMVTPAIDAFSVTVNGREREVTAIQGVSNRTMFIVIHPPAARGEVVKVSYRDLTSGNDATGVIQNLFGHDAESFTNVLATNRLTQERPEFIPAVNDRYDCVMKENPEIGSTVCNSFHPDETSTNLAPSGVHASAWAYSATDPDGETLTYSLEGPDADDFNINPANGNVTTKKDGSTYNGNTNGGKRAFRVTLKATNPGGLSDTQDARVTFEDGFEIISLNASRTWIRNGYVVKPRVYLRWDNPWHGGHSSKLKNFEIQFYDTRYPDFYIRKSNIDKNRRNTELRYNLHFDQEYMVRVVAKGQPRGGFEDIYNHTLDETPWRAFRTRSRPEPSSAPGDPLSAAFINAPVTHDGSTAFMMQLEFNATLTTGWEALRDSITVTNGTLTRINRVSSLSHLWNLEITPTSESFITIAVAPSGVCDGDTGICAGGRLLEEGISTKIYGTRPVTTVTSAEITSNPGENGTWDVGETVTAEVTFSSGVTIGGAPTIGITLDGVRRDAAYATYSGTTGARFSYPITAADAGATAARLVANSLDTSNGLIGDNLGGDVILDFAVDSVDSVDAVATLAIADAEVHEGPNATLDFVVTLAPAATTTVTVDYATADGTATQGADYTATTGTLTFAPGETTKTVAVPIVDDDEEDNGETMTLTLRNPVGAELTDAEATGTIRNTEVVTATFTNVPDSHPGSGDISLRIAFDGALSTGWEGVRHSLAVTNGTLTATHRIDGRSDLWGITVEPASDEDVTVRLNASADCADRKKTMCASDGRRVEIAVETIIPGPTPPVPATTVTIASITNGPGANGTWDFGETVTADVTFSAPATVSGAPTLGVSLGGVRREAAYATGSGTATVRFSYPVTAADAGASEARLIANGFNTAAGTISDAQNRLAVLDFTVESAPTLAIADAEATEGAGVSLTFTVTLAPAATETVTVDWATADGTATAGSDYTAGSGALTFAAGETQKTVTVAVLDDSTDEISETVTLTLSNASGASLGDGEATGTLADNEGPAPLTATFTNAPDAHDGSTAFPLRISLDAALSTGWKGVQHSLAVTNGTLTRTHRIDGRSDLWGITVEPASDEDVTVRLNASADCTDPKETMCASGGRRLETAISTVIPGPRAPLTAAFQAAPLSHDGATTFTLRLAFSDAISTGEATLRDESLAVTGGTVTRAAKVEERSDLWEIGIRPSSTAAVGVSLAAQTACTDTGAVCTSDGRALSQNVETTVAGPTPSALPALTAEFAKAPERHDSSSQFRVRLRFSAPVTVSPETLRDEALTVTGGTLSSVVRVRERTDLWSVRVTPSGIGAVSVSLAATASCDAAGAVCTSDGRALSAAASVRIAGPAPLTARKVNFRGGMHNGTTVFSVEIEFSDVVATTNTTMRDSVLTVTHGTVRLAQRVQGWSNKRWKFQIRPSSHQPVQIVLPVTASCEDAGAVCTSDGRALSNRVEFEVLGPRTLSVADAEVQEAEGATLDFTVRISAGPSGTVTVAYATSDGTATAGADYTAASGTLTFTPGELTKTVSVAVLDDGYDEDEETMTLTLSNVSGAYLLDGEAMGTIENSDPLQRAWLSRFGRTAATHVVDAVSDRLRGPRHAPSQVTIGGYRLPLGQSRGRAAGPATSQPGSDAEASTSALLQGVAGVLGLGLAGPGAPADGEPGSDPRLGQSQTLGLPDVRLRDVLLGSSFRLSLGATHAAGGPRLTAWGRVAGTQFDGKDGELTLDGDVFTGTVGVDGEWDQVLAGVAVAHSRGEGSFAIPGTEAQGRGELEQTLTSLHPYLRYAVTDRLDVWGLLGYGWGQMELEPGAGATLETDTRLIMGAFGGRGILLAAAETGGVEIATRTDAMLTRTSSDAVTGATGNLAAADAEAHRLRVVLEGSRGFALSAGRSLAPSVEVGLRHDWGDAETGFGLEVGGRVQYADPRLGLTIEGAVRALLAHEDSDYKEWGASGTVRLAPGPAGQGLSLTLSPTWGVASSGVDGLWSRQTTAGLAQTSQVQPATRLNAEVGYGVVVFDKGLLTPYAGTVLTDGAARTYRLGTRWTSLSGLALTLEGTRQEPAGPQPVNQGLQLQIGWNF